MADQSSSSHQFKRANASEETRICPTTDARHILLLAACLAAASPLSLAGNCSWHGTDATCTGDFSGGFDATPLGVEDAESLTLEGLTSDIANDGTAPGIRYVGDGGSLRNLIILQNPSGQPQVAVDKTQGPGIVAEALGAAGTSHGENLFGPGASGDDGVEGVQKDSGMTIGIPVSTDVAPGIYAYFLGGSGGHGGASTVDAGGHGGIGGKGAVGIFYLEGGSGSSVTAHGGAAASVVLEGGPGGRGGNAGLSGDGGSGGLGGDSGNLNVSSCDAPGCTETWSLATTGDDAPGLAALVQGGNAYGNGTSESSGATSIAASGGHGGNGGTAGTIQVSNLTAALEPIAASLDVSTEGQNSPAILLRGVAGFGGMGGQSDVIGRSGSGGNSGQGGEILVFLQDSNLSTTGETSAGLFAVSSGARGGNGGNVGASSGGSGGAGGGGGVIYVEIDGTNRVETQGAKSAAIAAYSIGGQGGQGAGGLWPGAGGPVSGSQSVAVATDSGTDMTTLGDLSPGIVAQSIGGHGGASGSAFGLIEFGAAAGSAGAGGEVGVDNKASINTSGDGSTAIAAQSLGGGGGTGGTNFGFFYSGGGDGGQGGEGSQVNVTNAGAITTGGNDATGIFAQSIGGTGGSGGAGTSKTVTLGGRAAAGSNASAVTVSNSGVIETGKAPTGTNPDPVCGSGCSHGILAQSIGGGGGNGGSSLSEISIGGTSGAGGHGGTVTITNTAGIATHLDDSVAIHAQSIGGGGGRGGASFGVAPGASIAVGVGGGVGGLSEAVTVNSTDGLILTGGKGSHGIVAQSIAGGGGHGSTTASVTGDIELPAVGVAVGGSGGSGNGAKAVSVTANSTIATEGGDANGILAQSIGGGGGNAGLTIAAAGTVGEGSMNLTFASGGTGGSGGDGGAVTVDLQYQERDNGFTSISTAGKDSSGIVAQSIGGGGGNGGITISGQANVGGSGGADVALGSKGGVGGLGSTVSVTSEATIAAQGDAGSHGIVAQSIGGGGGNGGMTLDLGVSTSEGADAGVALGGNAGSGSSGGAVTVETTGVQMLVAEGNRSKGIYAQSIGGGGGDAGITLNGTLSTSSDSQPWDLTFGSEGGTGNIGGDVTVTNTHQIMTGTQAMSTYTQAHGILAQSVGGGGGSGALTGTLQLSATSEEESHSIDLEMSNSGDGGAGGKASVTNAGSVQTVNMNSHGIFAQSVGGGGGDADSAYLSLANLVANDPSPSFSTSYTSSTTTGSLGSGNTGGDVDIENTGQVSTLGTGSHGLFAQSIGGGGGSNGSLGNPFSNCGNSSGCNAGTTVWNATVQMGGMTGNGGDGGATSATNGNDVTTEGAGSYALFAQSIGAGGGASGDASALSQAGSDAGISEFTALDLVLGALNSSTNVSGDGGSVTAKHNSGTLTTKGIGSTAIYAQSVGAGGGRAGTGAIGQGGTVTVGGGGDAGGDGGDVTVTVKQGTGIQTGTESGDATITVASYGIFAQSVGGGGGHAGNVSMGAGDDWNLYGLLEDELNPTTTKAQGNGGEVSVSLAGDLTTHGTDSLGIFAQSVGGGGGIQGEVSGDPTGAKIGSNGGEGTGGTVTVDVAGSITTSGQTAHGVFAQSVGGPGGTSSNDPNNPRVSVTVTGSIDASGGGATGIYAESSGDGSGPISVSIAQGASVVHGAYLSGTSNPGSGIVVKGGNNNVITNAGTIQLTGDASPSAGVAIRAVNNPGVTEPSQLTINNTGIIDGWICADSPGDEVCTVADDVLPAASLTATQATDDEPFVTLINEEGGIVHAGDIMEISALINHGDLHLDPDDILTSLFTGDLEMSNTGSLFFELGTVLEDTVHDVLAVAGSAMFQLETEIVVSLLPGFVPRANESFEILGASDLIFTVENLIDVFDLPTLPGFFWEATLTDASTASLLNSRSERFDATVPEVLSLTLRAAPEPTALSLMVAGGFLLALHRRRRFQAGERPGLREQEAQS